MKRELTKEESNKILKNLDPRCKAIYEHDKNLDSSNSQAMRVMSLAQKVYPDTWISVEGTDDPHIVDFVNEERMTRNLVDCGQTDEEIVKYLTILKGKV